MQSRAAYKLVQLVNGTYSVHSIAHKETFHPVIGPVAEAEALYVRQLCLPDRIRQREGEFVIWDVGLGAAANALTVLRATRELPCHLRLISFDNTVEPLRFALSHSGQLGYFGEYEPIAAALLSSPKASVEFTHRQQKVRWDLHLDDFPALLHSARAERLSKPHAILFDAYSTATNPAMWTQPLFARLHALLDPNRPCALPTYSRSTMLRVTLLLAGFFVGKGHATGEKEETTIAANQLELISEPLDSRWLSRARNSTSAQPLSEASYRQAPLSSEAWDRLRTHPQFHPHGSKRG